jgi:hypothetical protein
MIEETAKLKLVDLLINQNATLTCWLPERTA